MRAAQATVAALCLTITVVGGCADQSALVGTTGTQTTYLRPFADNASQTPRWMDIADNLYRTAFRGSYQYPAATAQLQYTTQQAPLQFAVSAPARALKPSFCYQMKLEGPSGEPWANSRTTNFENYQLGTNGRWWCDTCNAALDDAAVLQSGAHLGHLVKGYLYFDFVVAGQSGAAQQTSTVNSSYHVTWKASQRARGSSDGPVRTVTVVARKDGWAYDRTYRTTTVSLYGEREPGRPAPGTLALAPGLYEGVEFRLTEETFHATRPYGGNWRTVMVAPGLSFEVP